MRIENLPRELINELTRPLDKKDLLSLCLVSKTFIPLFRPYLFHTIKRLVISGSWLHEEEEDYTPEQRRRDIFFRNLDAFPHLAASISSLHLVICPRSLVTSKDVLQDQYDLTERTVALLKACNNLRDLEFELPGGTGQGDMPIAVLDAIPITLGILKISNRPLGLSGLAHILSRLSSLLELDLSESTTIARSTFDLPLFGHPLKIRLPPSDIRLYPVLTDILVSLPNLRSFHSSSEGVKHLAKSNNPQLRHLDVRGKVSKDRTEVIQAVVSVLNTSRRLEDVRIWLGPQNFRSQFENPADIVQALPPTIETLRLAGNHLFKWSSLLDFLRSERSESLREVYITRFVHSAKKKTKEEVEVEELCRIRGAKLDWCGEWDIGK